MEKDPLKRAAETPRLVWLRKELEQLAGEPVRIPEYLKEAEQLLEKGIQIPTYDPAKDKGKPTEEWLLLQIVKLLPGENLRQDIAEYMADRGYLERPPANSVADLVSRQTSASLRELIDVFGSLAEECEKIEREKSAVLK